MASKPQQQAQEFVRLCKELGWGIQRVGDITTIIKKIKPGCNDSFCRADSEYFEILGVIPMTTDGSIWGTDGGGIGAISAMQNGLFRMNKSGCSKRVTNWIKKLM